MTPAARRPIGLHLLDVLQDRYPAWLTAGELAPAVGRPHAAVRRALRVLLGRYLVTHSGNGQYAIAPVGVLILTRDPKRRLP